MEPRDDLVIGLSCWLYDTGKKVFYLNKRLDVSQRGIKIGEFKKGDDAPKAPTLAIVVEDFIRLYAKP